MNSKLKDAREGLIGFLIAFALFGSLAVIGLATFGYFDHGTTYRYPGQQRVSR